MIRRLARWAGRAALAIAILAALLVAVLHTPPGRNLLRNFVLAELRRGGLEARLDRLEVAPLRLEARIYGLELSRPGHPPFVRVTSAALRLRAATLSGRPSLRELAAHGVAIDLVRDAQGEWNVPQGSSPTAEGPSLDLRSLLQARLALTDLDLRARESGGAFVAATGLGLDWSGDTRRGTLSVRDAVTWRASAREGRLSLSPVSISADARELILQGLRLAGPEGEVAVQGAVGLVGATAPVSIGATGRLHLGPLLGPLTSSVRGDLPWKAQASGTLQGLAADLDFRSEGLVVENHDAEIKGQIRAADGRVAVDAALTGEALPMGSRLSAALKAQWPIGLPEQVEAALDTRVEPSGGQTSEGRPEWRGEAELRLSAGGYVLTLDHRLGAAARLVGRAAGHADLAEPLASPLGGSLKVDVTEPVALARLVGSPTDRATRAWWSTLVGQLRGVLSLEGTVGKPVASGTVSGLGLTIGGAPPLDADARLRVDRRELQLESLEVRGGLTVEGNARVPFDGGAMTGRAQGRLEDLAAWAAVLPSAWAPGGPLAFEVSLAGTVNRPEGEATVEGTGVTLVGQPPLSRLHARLRRAADATVILETLSLEQKDGHLLASGRFDPGTRSLSARATAEAFAVEPWPAGAVTERALPLRGRLSGSLDAGVEDGELLGGGRFELRDLSWDQRSLGTGRVELARDRTATHGFIAELRLDGADLKALARAADADDSRVSGSASLAARFRGDVTASVPGMWELDLDRLEGAAFDVPVRLRQPAHLRSGKGRTSLEDLEVDLAGGRLAGGGTLEAPDGGQELRVEWRGRLEGLSPLLAATAPEGETPPRLEGEGALALALKGTPDDPRPEGTLRITAGGVSRGDESLVQSTELAASFRDGILHLDALEAVAQGFHLALTGEAGAGLLPASLPESLRRRLGGPARARAHLSVGRADEASRDTKGEPLRVEADLETDGLGLERLRANATVTGLVFAVQDVPLRPDRDFTMTLSEGLLTVPTVVWHGGDNDLRLGGTARLPAGGGPVEASTLDLEASGAIDLRLLAALGRGVEAGGLAHLDAHLRGSPAAPEMNGSLRLEAAVLRYRPWRISLDDLSARVVATPGRLELETLSGTLNGGTLEGKGELHLSRARPSGGQVSLALQGAALDWPKGFRGSLDGGLELRGGAEGPVLSGSLTLANAAYKGDPRTLVPATKPTLTTSAAETSSLFAGLGLDVHVKAEHEVRVDTPFGAFPFSLDLRATGTADAPRLQGEVALGQGGFIYWSGRRFALERGALTWSPTGGLVPFLESRATTRVSNYTVTAQFSGPLTSAEAGLSSNPPLSENEIASLLTTGSTTSAGKDSRALGIVSANALGSLGKVAGLDSVRIESADDTSLLNFDPTRVASETNPAQRLTITKRLADNLEATVSLNLSESGKTTTFVGWKPFPAVEVRVAQRDDYTGSLELRHDVSFGGGGREKPLRPAKAAGRRGGHEIVRSVNIEDDGGGTRRRLLGKLKLQPGKTFRYEDWQKDRERVEAAVARRGYAEAYVIARREPRASPPEGGEVALTYLIRRGVRTRVEFREGLGAPDTVRHEIETAWSSGDFDTSIEEEAKERVRTHFAREGHFAPRLSAEVETSRDGKTRTLVVGGEAGPKARRRRVAFSGATSLPASKLEALVKGRALEDQAWNDPGRLERAVVALYREEGHLAAAVHARPAVVEGDLAVLTLEIDEGPLFRLGTLDLEGCVRVDCAQALAALGLASEAPYREAEVAAARARLVSFYRKSGFNAVQVRLGGEVRTGTAQVHVKAQVEEGPQQLIREIVVTGADPATRRALDRAVTLRPGQPVVLQDWAAIRKQLYGTGLVRGVTLEPEVLAKEDEPVDAGASPAVEPVRAQIDYDMWPALRLRYGLQLVTEKPLTESGDNAVDLGATTELTRAVFLGRAVSTALSAEVRPDIWNVRGVLSVPRTFGRPFRTSLYLVREHEKTEVDVEPRAFTIPAIGDSWDVTLEERWRRGKLETALSYDIEWLTLGFPETSFTDVSFRPARLIATVLLDGRNSILDPRKGYFSSLSGEYGAKVLGSEFNFSRIFTQQFAYVPLPGSLVAASGLRFERAAGEGQSFLTTERLAFGGPTTVRGYETARVTILDLFSAVGATTDVLVLNQELRFPILGDLRGVAFIDFGQIAAQFEGARGTQTRLGTGFGLRYSTPVGVLRVDLGFPLRGPEKKGLFYFGLGQAF